MTISRVFVLATGGIQSSTLSIRRQRQMGIIDRATGMLVDPNPEQLDALLYMVSVGLVKTEIQQVYPMTEVVEAHRQIETGHTRGKVLLDMQC